MPRSACSAHKAATASRRMHHSLSFFSFPVSFVSGCRLICSWPIPSISPSPAKPRFIKKQSVSDKSHRVSLPLWRVLQSHGSPKFFVHQLQPPPASNCVLFEQLRAGWLPRCPKASAVRPSRRNESGRLTTWPAVARHLALVIYAAHTPVAGSPCLHLAVEKGPCCDAFLRARSQSGTKKVRYQVY